jgi:hypothetical protein
MGAVNTKKDRWPDKDQNGWRIQTNDGLQVIYTKVNIVTTIEFRTTTLGWAGHVVRMSVDRTIKKVFLGKPNGRRKAGRPKIRCLDCIESDPRLYRE